jgi:hypothetical protein
MTTSRTDIPQLPLIRRHKVSSLRRFVGYGIVR